MRFVSVVLFAFLFVGCTDMAKTWWNVLDDDDKPSGLTGGSGGGVQFVNAAPSAKEGKAMVIQLIRQNPDATAVSTDYETVDSSPTVTATPFIDYEPVQGTLSWKPNEGGVKSIVIKIRDDLVYEGKETLYVRLFNQQGRIALAGIAGTILDRFDSPTLYTDTPTISASKGGTQRFVLRAGSEHANRYYLIAGSLDPSPGVVVGGVHVPLNVDEYTRLTIAYANQAPFFHTAGVLDTGGGARAWIRVASVPASLVGLRLYHAYVVHDNRGGVFMASNAVGLTVVK